MAAMPLPPLTDFPAAKESAQALHLALRDQYVVEVPISFWEGRLWLRISAQVYNTIDDYKALADAIVKLHP